MKKLFAEGLRGRKKSDEEEQANTLDRLVRDKEGVRKKLEEEEKEFILRRKEYVSNLVHLEKQEIERREKELDQKKQQLSEKKRLNQQVKDKFVEQMTLLEKKLEEVKIEHASVESELEAEIHSLEDKLTEVVMSLNEKLDEIEPSAPEADRDISLYPDLTKISRINLERSAYRTSVGSTGSSPQMSISSTASATSVTDKGETD